jgi:hypothetical protein
MDIRLWLKAFIIITSTSYLGCYSNWQDIDSIVNKISCDTSKDKVFELAKLDLLEHEWDQTNRVLSIYKNSDAIAVTFNKKGSLLSIAVSKSQVKLFGLFRKQGTPIIGLNCQNQTGN